MKTESSRSERVRQTCLCLVSAGLVLVMGSPSSGQSISPPAATAVEDAIVQESAAAYYVTKHRVDAREAERRLAIQDRSAGIADDLARALRDQYSGIWYDPAAGGKLTKPTERTEFSPAWEAAESATPRNQGVRGAEGALNVSVLVAA